MVDTMDIIEHWQRVVSEYSNKHEAKNGFAVNEENIMEALYLFVSDEDGIDWIGDVLDQMYTVEDIERILGDFDFKNLSYCIETVAELIPRDFRMNKKIRIKSKGIIWVINMYDKDPFPSNPHAHNLENNVKLHLGNGQCYIKRKYIHSVSKKDLIEIRERLLEKLDIQLPDLVV